MGLIRLLFSPSGWIFVGLLIGVFGGYLFWTKHTDRTPERSELTAFSGTVIDGNEKETQLKLPRGVELKKLTTYTLIVSADDGKIRKIRLPETILNADTIGSFTNLRVEGLLRDGRDDRVWEFTVGRTPLLTYATRLEMHLRASEADKQLGLKIIGLGLGACFVGFAWLYLRGRRWRQAYRT